MKNRAKLIGLLIGATALLWTSQSFAQQPAPVREYYPEDYAAGSSTGGIQEAINAAELAGGGKIVLSNTTPYKLTQNTTIVIEPVDPNNKDDEITLEGAGPFASSIRCQASDGCTGNQPIIQVVGQGNVTIRDLGLSYPNASSENASAIDLQKADKGVISNVAIDGNSTAPIGYGIHSEGAEVWKFDSIKARWWDAASYLDASADGNFRSNQILHVNFKCTNSNSCIRTATDAGSNHDETAARNIVLIGGDLESNLGCAIDARTGNDGNWYSTVQVSDTWFEHNAMHICSTGSSVRSRGNIYNDTTSGTYVLLTGIADFHSTGDSFNSPSSVIDRTGSTGDVGVEWPVGPAPSVLKPQ